MGTKTQNAQKLIPEAFRPAMKISEDGNTVFFTIGVPRYARYQIQQKRTNAEGLEEMWVESDRAKYAGSSRAATLFEYGEKRMTYDGFQADKLDDQTAHGIIEGAREWAENQIRYFYGERSKQLKGSSIPKVVRAATAILVENLIAQVRDEKGKRYSKKTLPEFVRASKTLDEVSRAAEQMGVGEKGIAKIIKAAQATSVEIDLTL